MKNLKKALAAVLAMSLFAASGSALAAVTGNCSLTGDDATFNATYDVAGKSLTAAITGAKAGEQMTFLILDKDAEANATTDASGKSYQAADIVYIDQKEAASSNNSFTGPINLERITGATTEMPDGTYPVKFGYYNASGVFKLATGNLVIATVVDPAVQSITTDAAADATANTPITITATVTAVGGASTAYTWAVTTNPNNGASVSGNTFTATKVGTYVVTATSTYDNTKTATKTITVTDAAPYLTSASISGANAAYTDETVTLTGSYVEGEKIGVTLSWAVSGNATLSASTGASTVVTPTDTGDVTVTLTATSTTGVTKTATHTIAFTQRPVTPSTKTITIVWGDIGLDNAADSADAGILLYAAVDKGDKTWSYNGYTFTFNSDVITDGEGKAYAMTAGGKSIVWGDVGLDNAADSADAGVLLYAAVDKGDKAWALSSGTAVFNESLEVTLTPQAE